jgi:hypothetical protein
MLRGYLDAVTSSGHIEGWAYDTETPFAGLRIAIVDHNNQLLGRGFARGFREDLLAADIAGGWCAFRIKLTGATTGVPIFGLGSIDADGRTELILRQSVPYVVREEEPIRAVQSLLESDPTRINSLRQLVGCEELFNDFIRVNGPDAFIRRAYLYLLERPADASGLAAYMKHLKAKKVGPYALLVALADSEEYRSRERQHPAPASPAFPFHLEA